MQQTANRRLVGFGMTVPQPGEGQPACPLKESGPRQKLLAGLERTGRSDTTAKDFLGCVSNFKCHRWHPPGEWNYKDLSNNIPASKG